MIFIFYRHFNKYFNIYKEQDFARLLLIVISVLYLTFGLIYYYLPTEDPLWIGERIGIALIFLLLFLISFFNAKIENNIYELTRFVSFLAFFHLIYLAYRDNFAINYLFSLLVVIVLANIIFKADRWLKWYNCLVFSGLVSTLYLFTDLTKMVINVNLFIGMFFLLTLSSYLISKSRYNLEQLWKLKSKQYEVIFNNSAEVIFLIDIIENAIEEDFVIKKINISREKQINLIDKNVLGKTFSEIFDRETAQTFNTRLSKCKEQKKTIEFTVELNLPEKNSFWDISLSPIIKNSEVIQIVGNARNITEQRKNDQRIEYLSYHDSLTDLYNRSYVKEKFEIYNAKEQLPLSLIIGDVNGLKIVNDAFGHTKGDQLLKTIADILKSCCRESDLIARWGGDEFLILLPRTDKNVAEKIFQRINKKIEEAESDPIDPSMALGYAVKNNLEEEFDTIFKKAEDHMYENKLSESKVIHQNIISSLKQTLYESSHENYNHCQRLKRMSVKLGKALELPENMLEDLSLLAELHDIGKVAVPDEIVEKEKDLTSQERKRLKQHTDIGYQIIKSSAKLNNIAEALLHHHENWDGTGYPQQLEGNEIPFLSRVIKVVNEYDKMIHYHPHVDSVTKEEAVERLKSGAGKIFDPDIVRVFVNKVLCG
ncbi:MAG: diguanylate cyclase domain-containing protein [bacterium]